MNDDLQIKYRQTSTSFVVGYRNLHYLQMNHLMEQDYLSNLALVCLLPYSLVGWELMETEIEIMEHA